MKPGTKIAIMLVSGIVVWTLIAIATFSIFCPQKNPKQLAEKALYSCVDKPESIEIIAVSEPDSVFGRDYVTMEEKMAIGISMMNISAHVMDRTGDLENVDFNDTEMTELLERQMSAMSAIRSLVSFDKPGEEPKKKPFNGWKVKIEYKAVSESGHPYHSEYWFITDKDAGCIVNSFEVPILDKTNFVDSPVQKEIPIEQLMNPQ